MNEPERTEETQSGAVGSGRVDAVVMPLREIVGLQMKSIGVIDADQVNETADTYLCFWASEAMAEKLQKKRNEGRGGWWNPDECSVEFLRECLNSHLLKGDMVDVMNFAAMIYAREALDAAGA